MFGEIVSGIWVDSLEPDVRECLLWVATGPRRAGVAGRPEAGSEYPVGLPASRHLVIVMAVLLRSAVNVHDHERRTWNRGMS